MKLMVDMGTKRNYHDFLGVDIQIIAAIRMFLVNSCYGSGIRPTLDEVNNFYKQFIENDDVIKELIIHKIRPLWSSSSIKSVALAFYLSGDKQYVTEIINSIIDKNINNKNILQLAYIKLSERSYRDFELTKLSMSIFDEKCKDYKILKLMSDLSIPIFFRQALDNIGWSHYYIKYLPSINLTRGKKNEKHRLGIVP
jgi:hypothetical protein